MNPAAAPAAAVVVVELIVDRTGVDVLAGVEDVFIDVIVIVAVVASSASRRNRMRTCPDHFLQRRDSPLLVYARPPSAQPLRV